VIALTSAVAGEGKSTCSANLAAEFARGGRDVLLVDLDLRRPAQSRLFGTGGGPGVTDVALGESTLAHAIKRVTLEGDDGDDDGGGLWVLTTGPLPPRPSDFVASGAFKKLLDDAREQFEVVILDMPPLLPVGDVPSVSPALDGLIVVANLRVLRRHDLREMQRVLATCRAPVLGCLLTGEAEHGKYGYGYAYGYPTASQPAQDLDEALPGA
jgi:capsular exopolysaccharide synthesis family protein